MAEMKPTSKPVLVFSQSQMLIAIFSSGYQAANFFGGSNNMVTNVCNGKQTTSRGYFFRYINDDVVIELSDIGRLNLEEYDKLCGISEKRRIDLTQVKCSKQNNNEN